MAVTPTNNNNNRNNPNTGENSSSSSVLGQEQAVQNLNNIAQILGRMTTNAEQSITGTYQPLNTVLTSIAVLSGSLVSQDVMIATGSTSVGHLAKGSDGTILSVAAGNLSYQGLSTLINNEFGTTQGDIIYRSATAWDNLAAGVSGKFLKTQGAGADPIWASLPAVPALSLALQVFTAGGTYTPTTGMIYALLFTVGGGAGGGGAASSTGIGDGGGGGGGSTSIRLVAAATVGASKVVTIGGTANGGTSGNNNGTAGNDTSIGTLCVGKGGSAGGGAAANSSGSSGNGGVVGTGDIRIMGEDGQNGGASTSVTTPRFPGGEGGASGMGFGLGGRWAGTASVTGTAGSLYGGGGAGGFTANSGGSVAGGTGAAGLAFVIEFVVV
jgi:hypothetical protein